MVYDPQFKDTDKPFMSKYISKHEAIQIICTYWQDMKIMWKLTGSKPQKNINKENEESKLQNRIHQMMTEVKSTWIGVMT